MLGKIKIRVTKGGTDAVAAFIDNLASHADDIKIRQPLYGVALDRNEAAIVAVGDS